MSICVGNLSYSVTQDDLTKVFSEYGGVKRVQLPTDRETGRARGFGFVEMESAAAEDAAIEALDGAEWMGRVMKVNKGLFIRKLGLKPRASSTALIFTRVGISTKYLKIGNGFRCIYVS